uniref:Uncharacterized protein n=1 Tax=Rhizophora mucronata TaxID=61149 RepID=A0A2P2J3I5_RHIMU
MGVVKRRKGTREKENRRGNLHGKGLFRVVGVVEVERERKEER